VSSLRQRRIELGLTLKLLAKRAKMSPQAIWVYETGSGRPKPQAIKDYARALGWDVRRTMEVLYPGELTN
jgi:transcriptional regulator with XRE-family HTH domain